MAEKIANMVNETTTTAGTGTLSLNGPAPGFQSFVDAIGHNNQCRYSIFNGIDFEIGLGTVIDGTPNLLTRDSVEESSNGNELVPFGTETKQVQHIVSAHMLATMYQPGVIYGVRWDKVHDYLVKGYILGGKFIEADYSIFPVQELMRRVLRDSDTNAVTLLDPQDSNLLVDGTTPATFDGSMGDLQVQIPAHYQLWLEDGDFRYILVGLNEFEFLGVKAQVPNCFRGRKYYYHDAFEGVLYSDGAGALVDYVDPDTSFATPSSDILRSLPGYKPWARLRRSEFRSLLNNRGGGTHQRMWDAHQMLATLFITEFKTLNSQSVLPGYTEANDFAFRYQRATGRTLHFGNRSGSVLVDFDAEDSDLKPAIAGGGSDWTDSTTTPGEFYYTGAEVPAKPITLFNGAEELIEGTLGALLDNEWAYGDQDSIGGDRLYVKLSTGDPDGLAADTLTAQLALEEGAYVANSYRGVENPFGNMLEFVDGINIDNTADASTVYVCHDPALFEDDTAVDYTDTGFAPGFGTTSGFIVDVHGEGNLCPLYPATIAGGSSDAFFCDYFSSEGLQWNTVRVGGFIVDELNAGMFSVMADLAAASPAGSTGSRGGCASNY